MEFRSSSSLFSIRRWKTEVPFLVAEEERNEIYLMLESVGEFHIIVVLEIQAELAKRQRVVVYPIASV